MYIVESQKNHWDMAKLAEGVMPWQKRVLPLQVPDISYHLPPGGRGAGAGAPHAALELPPAALGDAAKPVARHCRPVPL